ncbi:MAG: glucose 1-dehydrogenase [Actinobacteria bacterium]|nr:glucose 1-dehydrogenase [Actinomycetota bacterium]
MRVENKVALITGGARGMGASHARLLAEEGAAVAVADILDELGRETVDELLADGHRAHYVSLDVTDEAAWGRAIAEVEEALGAPTILVNNAGVGGTVGGVEVEDASTWNATVAINQTGTFLGMHTVAPVMRRAGGGSIINISSILGFVADGDGFAYCATKGAIRMMTRSAALKLAGDGIRVNAICPGIIRTPMNEMEPELDVYIDATPLKRLGEPKEVSYAVLFLASDEASFVTGADLLVDGGYVAQ